MILSTCYSSKKSFLEKFIKSLRKTPVKNSFYSSVEGVVGSKLMYAIFFITFFLTSSFMMQFLKHC